MQDVVEVQVQHGLGHVSRRVQHATVCLAAQVGGQVLGVVAHEVGRG